VIVIAVIGGRFIFRNAHAALGDFEIVWPTLNTSKGTAYQRTVYEPIFPAPCLDGVGFVRSSARKAFFLTLAYHRRSPHASWERKLGIWPNVDVRLRSPVPTDDEVNDNDNINYATHVGCVEPPKLQKTHSLQPSPFKVKVECPIRRNALTTFQL
jgi:hypothetical protein